MFCGSVKVTGHHFIGFEVINRISENFKAIAAYCAVWWRDYCTNRCKLYPQRFPQPRRYSSPSTLILVEEGTLFAEVNFWGKIFEFYERNSGLYKIMGALGIQGCNTVTSLHSKESNCMAFHFINIRYPVIISRHSCCSHYHSGLIFIIWPRCAKGISTFKVPTGTTMLEVKYIRGRGNNILHILGPRAPQVDRELSAAYKMIFPTQGHRGPGIPYKPCTWRCTPACKWAIHYITPIA